LLRPHHTPHTNNNGSRWLLYRRFVPTASGTYEAARAHAHFTARPAAALFAVAYCTACATRCLTHSSLAGGPPGRYHHIAVLPAASGALRSSELRGLALAAPAAVSFASLLSSPCLRCFAYELLNGTHLRTAAAGLRHRCRFHLKQCVPRRAPRPHRAAALPRD